MVKNMNFHKEKDFDEKNIRKGISLYKKTE